MTATRLIAGMFPLLLALSVGCTTSVTPVPISGTDICFRCRRPISDVRLAAEIVDASHRAYKFRTVSCLATYLTEREETPQAIFVTDYPSGRLVRAGSASFVEVIVDTNTRARDYRAFQTRAEAQAHALEHGSELVDWNDVMSRAAALLVQG